MLTILAVETSEEVSTARELIMEYATWLEFKLCFQGFEEEMQSLPGKYASPAGRLLLALWDGTPAGVIALRSLEEPGLCEMKRLYVRPEFRGHQIGRILAERIIKEASEIGYSRMRLDTIAGKMDRAITMHRELGFAETDPYYQTPVAQTLFMELALTAATGEKQFLVSSKLVENKRKKNRSSLKTASTHVINSAVCGRARHDP